jgi:hypothetical protein
MLEVVKNNLEGCQVNQLKKYNKILRIMTHADCIIEYHKIW